MIKLASKYYLKFPPIARNVINVSISGFMNGIGVDYYVASTENMLFECNDVLNKNIFS